MEVTKEQVLTWIKEKGAKAVYVEKFTHLDTSMNVVTESLIYFKPKVFGKSSTRSYIQLLGLKTKDDCDGLNQELSSVE